MPTRKKATPATPWGALLDEITDTTAAAAAETTPKRRRRRTAETAAAPVAPVEAAAAAAAPEAAPVAAVADAAAAAAPVAPVEAAAAAEPDIAIIRDESGDLDIMAMLAQMKAKNAKPEKKATERAAYSQATVEAVGSLGWKYPKGGKIGRAPQDLSKLDDAFPLESRSDVVNAILIFSHFGNGKEGCARLAHYERVRLTDYVVFLSKIWPLISHSGWGKDLDRHLLNLANATGRYALIDGDFIFLSSVKPEGYRFRDKE